MMQENVDPAPALTAAQLILADHNVDVHASPATKQAAVKARLRAKARAALGPAAVAALDADKAAADALRAAEAEAAVAAKQARVKEEAYGESAARRLTRQERLWAQEEAEEAAAEREEAEAATAAMLAEEARVEGLRLTEVAGARAAAKQAVEEDAALAALVDARDRATIVGGDHALRLAEEQKTMALAEDARTMADRALAVEVQRKYERLDAKHDGELAADERLARAYAEAESVGAAAAAKAAKAQAKATKAAAKRGGKNGFRAMVFGQ